MSDAYTLLNPGITQAQLDAAAATNLALMQAQIPALAASAPPAVGAVSVVGSATAVARSDHTHQSSVQRARVSVPLTAGRGTWTFAQPYPSGVVPVVQATAETPDDTTYFYDARIVSGTLTNTGVQLMVNKISKSVTLPSLATSLLGFVVNIFAPATGTVIVDCWAAPATA